MARSLPTAGQAADILHLIAYDPAGRPAGDIDGNTRAVLLRRGWITMHRAGQPVDDPGDWAATATPTTDGLALARAAAALPVALSNPEGRILARFVDVYAGHHVGWWTGTAQSRRIVMLWRLVDFTESSPGSRGLGTYRITEAGREAVQRWRAQLRVPATASTPQHDTLTRLADGAHVADNVTLRACVDYGWVRMARPAPDQPVEPALTEAGRAILAAGAPRRQRTYPRRLVSDLQPGQQCRLANRHGWRSLTAEWVTFRHAVKEPRPGGWMVYVDDGAGGERPYTGTPLGYQTRFEVKD